MVAQGLGGISFFLICAIIALVILAMAANERRRLGTAEYGRMAGAAGVILVGRLAGAVLLSRARMETACLEPTLEALALIALTWAYLFGSFSSRRSLFFYAAVSLAATSGLLAWCALPGAGDPTPDLVARAWMTFLLLLSAVALGQWARRRRQSTWGLASAFGISLLGAVGGLLGLAQAVLLGHLAALCLFAIETYRSILSDLSAYGQELQTVSERALRQTREMAFLLEVSQAIAASLDLPVVLERVSESAGRAVNADWAYILLPQEGDDEHLVVAAQYGWWGKRWQPASPVGGPVRLRLADFPPIHEAVRHRRQVVANRPEEYEPLVPLHELLGRSQTGPTLVQPILLQKRSLGAALLGHVDAEATFSFDDAKLCQALMGQVAAAIDNARLYQSVDDQARRLAELLRVREEEATQRQAILESIADGVVVAGDGGDVVLANAAAERILGLSRRQLLGQAIKRLYAELLRARGRGKGEQAVFEWDAKVVKGSLAPVKMPDGTLLGYVAVFRDVTRERQAEESKSQFVATVSHELRTPMTSIKGYIELLTAGAVGELGPQQRRFLDVVQGNTERMIGLVNNLIAVSEMERGLVQIEPRPVDMKGVLQEAVQSVRAKAAERQMEVTLNLPPGLCPARGDPQRLRQIVDNLLDNALRYTPARGRIDVWATEARLEEGDGSPRPYVVVNVRDTGVGISLEEQDRIFEKFYRAQNDLSLEAGGTGMGLAIVKTLVEAHGGHVWVDSQPGEGSTFRFTIPSATFG